MSDAATRAAEALEELRAELTHADALITEQQTRIEKLERHIVAVAGEGSGHQVRTVAASAMRR